MIERMLTLGDFVTMQDVRRVVETAKQMGDNEQLVVSMNSQDAYKAESILSVLEKNNFKWATKGAHDGTGYYIIARKESK